MSRGQRDGSRDVATILQRKRDGLCVQCGGPNDRAGLMTKSHVPATRCTDCLNGQHADVDRARARANAAREDTAAALGLTPAQAAALTRRERAKK